MKRFVVLLICLKSFVAASQALDVYGNRINCDSAKTILEIGYCARCLADRAVTRYDSLVSEINRCLDTLIIQDRKNRRRIEKENSKESFDLWTNYSRVKKLFIQSGMDFKHYADNEMYIEGEFYGPSRDRGIGEDLRLREIYDRRIAELLVILKTHCGNN